MAKHFVSFLVHALVLAFTVGASGAPPPDAAPTKRARPDFDGRGEEPTTASDVLLWIPRGLLFPLYLVAEYVVRRPVGALIVTIEGTSVAKSSGTTKTFGFVPTFFYEANLLPNVGLYFWWDQAPKNQVRAHASTWGPGAINATVLDRYALSNGSTVSLRGAFSRRIDAPFFGLGPESRQGLRSRYEARHLDVAASHDRDLGAGARLTTVLGAHDAAFDEDTCCGSPSLHARIRAGQLPAPPRLADGFTAVYQRAALGFDTRPSATATGLRLAVDGEPAFDLSHRPGSSWLKYDASVAAFWDVTGEARTLSLSLATLFVDPLAGTSGAIPFTELATLGGFGLMRGYLPGRLVDRSAVAATLAYAWPIWSFLDGTIEAAVGNVFGAGLRGFEAGKLRLSGAIGIRSNRSRDLTIDVLTGLGTDTFDRDATVTSFRLALGVTHGF